MGAQGLERQLEMDDLLLQGIAAARAGKRSEARAILMQVVEQDERNEQAWLWLSGVMDDPEEVRTCLENVLELNPSNVRARQGLEWLGARYGPRRSAPEPQRSAYEIAAAEVEPRTPRIFERSEPPEPQRPARQEQAARPARQEQAARPAAPNAPTLVGSAAADAAGRLAEAAQARERRPEQAAPLPRPADAAESPCPYCGAPTSERQQSCTQCRQSLMVQAAPPAQPSRWLGGFAGAAGASGAALILCGLALLVAALLAYQAARFSGPDGQEVAGASLPLGLVTAGVALGVLGAGALSLSSSLRRRLLPAYYAAATLAPLALVVTLFALWRGLHVGPIAAQLPEAQAGPMAAAVGGLLGLLAALLAISAALGFAAYRDFFGPMVRFAAVVQRADPTTHYNNGVAYKDRGMWYMATREWERAVAGAPRDINYLRALGLAYAQVKRFDQAREMLDRALTLAPNHAQLTEDRAVVERLSAR